MTKAMEISEVKYPSDAKSLKRAITDTMLAYGNVKVRLHVLAVASLIHAAVHGDAQFLTQMHSSLMTMKSEKDADNLRSWSGDLSAYIPEGETKPKNWLGYTKEKGFFVKAGTADVRNIDKDTALNGVRFYNLGKAEKIDPTLEMILDYLTKIEKSADSKAEKGGVSIPVDVRTSIKALAAAALTAKAAASVTVQ